MKVVKGSMNQHTRVGNGHSPAVFIPASIVENATPIAENVEQPDYLSVYRDPACEQAYRSKNAPSKKPSQSNHGSIGYIAWSKDNPAIGKPLLSKISGKRYASILEVIGEKSKNTPKTLDELTQNNINDFAVIYAGLNKDTGHDEAVMLEKFRWCVEAGADLGFVNSKNLTALEAAARFGNDEVVKYLLDEVGLNPNHRGGGLPLCAAGRCGSAATIKLLVDRGAWLSGRDKNDTTVFHELFLRQHIDTINHILQVYPQHINVKPNQKIDFSIINFRNMSVLGTALICLEQKHVDFKNDHQGISLHEFREEHIQTLSNMLQPIISLCISIHRNSGLSYGLCSSNNKRRSISPLTLYARKEKDVRDNMIKQLCLVNPDFINDICKDYHSGDNDAFDTFYVVANTFLFNEQHCKVTKQIT